MICHFKKGVNMDAKYFPRIKRLAHSNVYTVVVGIPSNALFSGTFIQCQQFLNAYHRMCLTRKATKHEIKIYPEFFDMKLKGLKNWEYRYNDRNYQIGDLLIEREWTEEGGYTGRELTEEVVYILPSLNDFLIMSTIQIG